LFQAHYLAYRDTRRFSELVLDYLDAAPALSSFYQFRPDEKGLEDAIAARQRFPVNREVLVNVLREQYAHLPLEEKVEAQIELLTQENCFTICTAHQPNLATGYLYFIYKILHAIKLAASLNKQYPDKHFVPVYYMGSEDADLDELGSFRFRDRKFTWDANGQTGAVGRMTTDSLTPLLDELFLLFGPPGNAMEELQLLLRQAYAPGQTIGTATRKLVHGLFGKYGLVIIDPDQAELKRCFLPVMEEDLFQHSAENLARRSMQQLEEAGYSTQAFPRPINLFYLEGGIRQRIEQDIAGWMVVGTNIHWSRIELLAELQNHPERFSPNVILRPLYQETILPNVAFIGGGAEVAYWLQLKSLFNHHQVFYPSILLRQSIMWVESRQAALRSQTGFQLADLFLPKHEAARLFVNEHAENDWQVNGEQKVLEQLLNGLRSKAQSVDPTLERSAEAALKKMQYQLDVLGQKMLRAAKRGQQTGLSRVERLQDELFPGGGLAERRDNFMPYYLEHGREYFDILLEEMEPMKNEFLVIEHTL
jgi:bacillithiol biosynthesis cysteine-adding enzyme BshC